MRPLHRRTLAGATANMREKAEHARLLAQLARETDGNVKAERAKHIARRRERYSEDT